MEPRVAKRYAKSLLGLAIERGELERAHADMKVISNACLESRDLGTFLSSPIINSDKKKNALVEIFSGQVSELTLSFIVILTIKKRESYLEAVANSFLDQYKTHNNILTATFTSANGVDAKVKEKVQDLIKKQMNAEVELTDSVDEKLLGGFVLRVGDKQIDASIKNKLRQLKRNFSENPYVQDF